MQDESTLEQRRARARDASRRYRLAHPEQVRDYWQRYRSEHAEELRERGARYREQDPEHATEVWRRSHAKHRDERNAASRAYGHANPEKRLATTRAWHVRNPEKRRLYARARRALERSAPGSHTVADVQFQHARQVGRCYWCSCALNARYHVDHVVPLSRGGTNGAENIVISCPSCNQRRSFKLPHEWPEGGRLL